MKDNSIGKIMKTLNKKNKFSLIAALFASLLIFQQGVSAQEGLIFQKKLETEPGNTQILEAKKMLVEKANTPGGVIGAYELGLHQFKGTYNIRTSPDASSNSNLDGQGTLGQLATIVEVTNIIYTYSNGEKHPWVKIKYDFGSGEKTNYVIGNGLEKVTFNLNVKKYATGQSASGFVYRDSDLQYNICAVEDNTKKDCPASNVEPGNVDNYIAAKESKTSFDLDISKLLSGKQDPHKINKVYVAIEIFYSEGNKRNNFTIAYSNKTWKLEGGNKDLVYNTSDKKWRFTAGGTPIGETPDVVNEDPEKVDQVGGFPFESTSITAGNNGTYTVVGKLKISLMNISLGAASEREVQFTVDNKACLVGGEINFTNSQAGNWEVQGNWFSSQLLISFSKLVASTCTTGYLQGSLNLNSQATLPYINGEKKFSATVRLNKEGRLYDPADASKGPGLTQTGTPVSTLYGYGFTVSGIRLSNSLSNSFTFEGNLFIPLSGGNVAGINRNVTIKASNSALAEEDINIGNQIESKAKNIDLVIEKVRFKELVGSQKLHLIGKVKLPGVFANTLSPLTGVAVNTNGKLLPTNNISGNDWITKNGVFNGHIKMRYIDLVQNIDGENWDLKGDCKLKASPRIFGRVIPSMEITIPEIVLEYDSGDNRSKLEIPIGVSSTNSISLASIFLLNSQKIEIDTKEESGKNTEVIKIAYKSNQALGGLLKLYNHSKKVKKEAGLDSISIAVYPSGKTELDELGIEFKLVKDGSASDETNLIDFKLTYKNSQLEASLESKWLPVGVEIGIDFGEQFGFYIGLSMDVDKLPGKLGNIVSKSLGKLAPKSVGIKLGYWKPEGADQRRAFLEVSASGIRLPPFPIVELSGRLLIGFSWEASYRIDLEAELSAKIDLGELTFGLVKDGLINLGNISLVMFVDMSKGDFGLDIAANVGPDLTVLGVKIDAKAKINFAIGYVNSTWRFYYDTSVGIKLKSDYESTLIDVGFHLEVAAGFAIGRNNPVKLYIPATLVNRLKSNAAIVPPSTFGTGGGFILYGSSAASFYIDLPGFSKKTWSLDMALYLHIINSSLTLYAGANFTTSFFFGDPVEVRMYATRKPGAKYTLALVLWDIDDAEVWKSFQLDL